MKFIYEIDKNGAGKGHMEAQIKDVPMLLMLVENYLETTKKQFTEKVLIRSQGGHVELKK